MSSACLRQSIMSSTVPIGSPRASLGDGEHARKLVGADLEDDGHVRTVSASFVLESEEE